MKRVFWAIVAIVMFATFFPSCDRKRSGPPKILIFSKTMGFVHPSIPDGIKAIQKLGSENGFEVDTTTNAGLFNDEELKQYASIVFLSTTGNVLDHYQEAAFERYIQSGGGFVGVHAATDTEYDWGWYGKLVGAYFQSHPAGTPEADFVIEDKDFVATEFFTDSVWHRTDELYSFKKLNPAVNVLMTVDESTYEGGENGDYHPMSWYHEFDGGRAFYTAAGHTSESFEEELFLKHLLGGITYAIGENLELDYTKVKSQMPPEIDRFSKKQLITGEFFEPTEMAVLPNNDVLIAQRRGEIMHYSDATKELRQVALLDVYHKPSGSSGVNIEEGLMGLQKDPEFSKNNWIYVYYAPSGDEWINRLSRFKFVDGQFELDSEQVILEIDSTREICCHTGGSIAFGPDDLLYLSTGDNSTPFDEPGATYVNNGYAPLNDLPGKENFDARRTSGNTNDLRGKILRIKVNEDGSYSIPEGNLFAQGTDKTRPEIYTMGHRNPYRISVDPKNGYLYWGDIGPDARQDDYANRGPMGYDEMGLAREAGNYGWPLFVADNKPYVDYDYATGKSGKAFDPENPINDSNNNTGLTELPPAMPAYIFYPYGSTQDFPQVGAGGRNAMAGPVYYSDLYDSPNKLPSYYDGKAIIYEWMRGWMMAVHLFEDGTFNKMEPFATDISVNSLIDMELSEDGRIYLLEYGSGWFTKNDDAGLSYIEFNGGNRPPVIENLVIDRTSGKLPLAINAEVAGRDREKDEMVYLWDFGDGNTRETKEGNVQYTYDKAGDYKISVVAKDDLGAVSTSEFETITAGNSRPEVSIDLQGGNSSFFVPGVAVNYEVTVQDPDLTEIDPENIFVSVDYIEGMDQVNMSLGHQQVSGAVMGKALTQSMDCKTCHKEKEPSIGPNYLEIAQKYEDDANALSYLREKIVEGGGGVWGEVVMPAHPDITPEESNQIALYIQSLVKNEEERKSLPAKGIITPNPSGNANVMVLKASYTDEGNGIDKPLTGFASATLQSSTVDFAGKIESDGFTQVKFGGMNLLLLPEDNGWFVLKDIDLTGVEKVTLTVGWQAPPSSDLNFELYADSKEGKLLGKGNMPKPVSGQPGGVLPILLDGEVEGRVNKLYFVYAPQEGEDRGPAPVALINATFN